MDFGQKIFHEIDLFDFTSFLAWIFLKFSGPLCSIQHLQEIFRIYLFKYCKLNCTCNEFIEPFGTCKKFKTCTNGVLLCMYVHTYKLLKV